MQENDKLKEENEELKKRPTPRKQNKKIDSKIQVNESTRKRLPSQVDTLKAKLKKKRKHNLQ